MDLPIRRGDPLRRAKHNGCQRQADQRTEVLYDHVRAVSVLEFSHASVEYFGDVGSWYCGCELLPINKIQQFVSFYFFYPAVGQRHKCACGDQALHHIFVAIVESIGHVFGRCGARTAVSLRHDCSCFLDALHARQWSRPVFIGEFR
jgi:hypothetical protein